MYSWANILLGLRGGPVVRSKVPISEIALLTDVTQVRENAQSPFPAAFSVSAICKFIHLQRQNLKGVKE